MVNTQLPLVAGIELGGTKGVALIARGRRILRSARVPTVLNGMIKQRDFQSLITPSNSPRPRSRSSRDSRRHSGAALKKR